MVIVWLLSIAATDYGVEITVTVLRSSGPTSLPPPSENPKYFMDLCDTLWKVSVPKYIMQI